MNGWHFLSGEFTHGWGEAEGLGRVSVVAGEADFESVERLISEAGPAEQIGVLFSSQSRSSRTRLIGQLKKRGVVLEAFCDEHREIGTQEALSNPIWLSCFCYQFRYSSRDAGRGYS